LLLQRSIAIIASFGLALFEVWPRRKRKMKDRDQFLPLAIALVQFHRNQCYFISAIEMAALLLGNEANNDQQANATIPDVFSIMLSIPVSINVFVPLIVTLTCMAHYARLSWHLVIHL